MRITSGHARGMQLSIAKGSRTRPTAEKVRQAVFDVLGPQVAGSTFIDLFAGSGAMGIEAVSRGAHRAVLVEHDSRAFDCLKKNVQEFERRCAAQSLEIPDLHLSRLSVDQWFKRRKWRGNADIIWADPPYADSVRWLHTLEQDLYRLSSSGGTLIWELPTSELPSDEQPSTYWSIWKTRSYGRTTVCYANRQPDTDSRPEEENS